jgi:hypothetical protein
MAGSRLKSKLLGTHLYRQIHGRPVPPCFPATWKCWKEVLIAFEHQTLFLSNQESQRTVVKTLLVSASICFFAQSSIFPLEAERLPL